MQTEMRMTRGQRAKPQRKDREGPSPPLQLSTPPPRKEGAGRGRPPGAVRPLQPRYAHPSPAVPPPWITILYDDGARSQKSSNSPNNHLSKMPPSQPSEPTPAQHPPKRHRVPPALARTPATTPGSRAACRPRAPGGGRPGGSEACGRGRRAAGRRGGEGLPQEEDSHGGSSAAGPGPTQRHRSKCQSPAL